MRVVHLGVLSSVDLEPDILEEISGADIMFVPAGEEDTLTAKETSKLATSLEPKIIIPVLYGENIKSPLLKDLIEEIGESKDKPTDKLAIKKKDLEGKATDMVILQVS
jgi:L-ascorbate metabolism protein UlaG (beta-lactamase superfamily)